MVIMIIGRPITNALIHIFSIVANGKNTVPSMHSNDMQQTKVKIPCIMFFLPCRLFFMSYANLTIPLLRN